MIIQDTRHTLNFADLEIGDVFILPNAELSDAGAIFMKVYAEPGSERIVLLNFSPGSTFSFPGAVYGRFIVEKLNVKLVILEK